MKMLEVEVLKAIKWERVNNDTFKAVDNMIRGDDDNSQMSCCENYIYDMTGVHIPTVRELFQHRTVKFNISYQRQEENEIALSVHVWFEDENGNPIYKDSITCEGDVLNLFSTAEVQTEVESVENFFKGNASEIVQKISERFTDVYNAMEEVIKENVIKHLDEYDIPTEVKSDIAEEWIEQNGDEAFEKAKDAISYSDLTQFVKDFIDENL